MSMSLFTSINNNSCNNTSNNQETKIKQENYVKRLEELEAIVEKELSDVKFYAPSNPIIGVTTAVGAGINDDEDDDDNGDDDDDDDDDDATLHITMDAMDDGAGILDDTDDA